MKKLETSQIIENVLANGAITEREEIEGKILSGYYTESAIQERQEAKRIAEIEKKKRSD